MYWYARFFKDYAGKTAELTLVQHGAYTLLLDLYYATGKPLPADRPTLYRVLRAFRKSERSAIETVLAQFFDLQSDGFHNRRADEEIAAQAAVSAARGKAARARWGDANACADALHVDMQTTMQKPCQSQSHSQLHSQSQSQSKSQLDRKGSSKRRGTAQAAPQPSPSGLVFSGLHLRVTAHQDRALAEGFPWVDREAEYRKADAWLEANPDRRVKKHGRFIHNWFSRIPPPSAASRRKGYDKHEAEEAIRKFRAAHGLDTTVAPEAQRALQPSTDSGAN